jgi:hypothetical protein
MAGIISALIFFPTNPNTGGLFFSIVSWPRHYFAQGEAAKLNWHLQEQEFKVHDNIKRIVALYTQMTLVFLIIIYGTRILGIFWLKRIYKDIERGMFFYFLIPTLLSNFIALFFLQRSGAYEIFNFFAVSGVVLSLFTAIMVSDFLKVKNRLIYYCILIIFVATTIPRSVGQAYFYINQAKNQKTESFNFSYEDMAIFNYMKININKDELVVVNIDDEINQYSPYVAGFSGVRMYFAGNGVLKAHGLKTEARKNEIERMWNLTNGKEFATWAKERKIKYLFLKTGVDPKALIDKSYFETIIASGNSRLIKIIY